jgi:hypothetical protein
MTLNLKCSQNSLESQAGFGSLARRLAGLIVPMLRLVTMTRIMMVMIAV